MPYFVYRRKGLFWDDCECHTLFIGEKAYSEMIVNAILFSPGYVENGSKDQDQGQNGKSGGSYARGNCVSVH